MEQVLTQSIEHLPTATTLFLDWLVPTVLDLFIDIILCYHAIVAAEPGQRSLSGGPMWLSWTSLVLGSGGFTYVGVCGYGQSEQVYLRGLREVSWVVLVTCEKWRPLGMATSLWWPVKWLSWISRSFIVTSTMSAYLMCWQWRGGFMGPVLGVRAVFILWHPFEIGKEYH